MKIMKKVCKVLLAFTLLMQPVVAVNMNIQVKAAEEVEAFSATWAQDYAKVGDKLSVNVTGAQLSDCKFRWTVDGRAISNATNSLDITQAYIQKIITVNVTTASESTSLKMLVSDLPVVYIDVENGQDITSKDYYLDADLKISNNEKFKDLGIQYDGKTEIKGRGNSTWGLAKKPYRLKLKSKADLFGMGKSKHWVLLANYLDQSNLRNTIGYELSGKFGLNYQATTFVDVVLNGEKKGIYQLCEQVRVGKTNTPIFDWEGAAEDLAAEVAKAHNFDDDTAGDLEDYLVENLAFWVTSETFTFNDVEYKIADYYDVPSINGGYLIELDAYMDEASCFETTLLKQPLMFKSPEFIYKTGKDENGDDYKPEDSDIYNFVAGYIDQFEHAITNTDKTGGYDFTYVNSDSQKVHYTDLYDMDALVDYWLMQEIYFNEDAMKKSTYMHKDIDGKMMMGPLWDLDWAAHGSGDTAHTDKWQTIYFSMDRQANQWYKFLMKDPYFLTFARDRWIEVRPLIENVIKEGGEIDQYEEYLYTSAKANAEQWYGKNTFGSEVSKFRNWMRTHIAWMDAQFNTKQSLMNSAPVQGYDENIKVTFKEKLIDQRIVDPQKSDKYDAIINTESDLVFNISDTNTYDLYVNGILKGQVKNGDAMAYKDMITDANDTNVVVVAKQDGTAFNSYTITNRDPEIVSVEASLDNTNVELNQTVDPLSNLKVVLTYDTGVKKDASVDDYELVSDVDVTKIGIYTVKVVVGTLESNTITIKVFDLESYRNELNRLKDIIDNQASNMPASDLEGFMVLYQTLNDELEAGFDDPFVLADQCAKLKEKFDQFEQVVSDVSGEALTYSKAKISWSAMENATSYQVFKRAGDSGEYTLVGVVDANTTSLEVGSLKTGSTYSFVVRAINEANDFTKYSESISLTPIMNVAPVITSVTQKTYGTLQVTWKGVSGAQNYYLERRKVGDTTWKHLKTFPSKTRTAESRSLDTGTKYEYRIRCSRNKGDERAYSEYSNIMGNTPVMKTTTVSVTKKSSTSVRVSWKTVSGASGYEIFRATSSKGKYTRIKTVEASNKSITSKSLVKGKTYYYKVRAYRNIKGKKVYNKYSNVVKYIVK